MLIHPGSTEGFLCDRLKQQSPTGIVLNSMVTYKKIVFSFCHKVNPKVIALLLS